MIIENSGLTGIQKKLELIKQNKNSNKISWFGNTKYSYQQKQLVHSFYFYFPNSTHKLSTFWVLLFFHVCFLFMFVVISQYCAGQCELWLFIVLSTIDIRQWHAY